MIDWLINIDKEWLVLCNSVHTPWLDNFFWTMSARWLNIFVAIPLLLIMMHRRVKWEAVMVILAVALTVLLCDQIASSVFKPLFQRPRPTHNPDLAVITVNNYRGGLFGSISSHAANTFGVAILLSLIFRDKLLTCTMLMWAALVSYSRIFLGVHYPADVLCGAVVGCLVAYLVYVLYDRSRIAFLKKGLLTSDQNPYRLKSYALFLATSVNFIILFVAIFASF